MLAYIVISSLFVIQFSNALTCHQGTSNSENNCTTGDECLTFSFSGTNIYNCGNCSDYQNYSYALSCCATDNCQNVTAPQTGCNAYLTESSCISDNDCYWCGNSSFGVDFCQPLYGNVPCWGMPVLAPVCGYVGCPPADPPYTVDVLTLKFLTDFGFPAVTTVFGDVGARGIGLDLIARDTRYLNDTYNFCQVDSEIQQWCGVNSYTKFSYCVISETWPQDDTWGWLQNTTLGASTLTPIYPAICACPIPGRAYYIPYRSTDTRQHFGPSCPVEHTLLAFFILLIILSVILMSIIFYDTLVLIVGTLQTQEQWIISLVKSKTIWVKILLILYFFVTITNQFLFIIPTDNTSAANAKAVLRFLGVILLLLAFSQAVFTLVEILLKAGIFGDRSDAWLLTIFKWFFFSTNGFFLVSANALVIVFAVDLKQLQDLAVENLSRFAYLAGTTTPLAQAIMLILLVTQGVMMIETGFLLCIVTWKLRNLDRRIRGMKEVMGRVIGLWLAWGCGLPNLGILAFITPVIAWITTGAIPSYWTSTYLTNIAYLWLIWADFMTELLWICAIAYAMRTVAKKGWLQAQFAILMGKKTMMDDQTDQTDGNDSNTSGLSVATTMQSTINSSHE